MAAQHVWLDSVQLSSLHNVDMHSTSVSTTVPQYMAYLVDHAEVPLCEGMVYISDLCLLILLFINVNNLCRLKK